MAVLAFHRKVGVPFAGNWVKVGSVLPKPFRLAASLLDSVPVPVAVQRMSESLGELLIPKEPMKNVEPDGVNAVLSLNVVNDPPLIDTATLVGVQYATIVSVSPALKV